MKILHCADLHLDSVMNTNLTPAKAKERKAELLDTFCNMVRYGVEQKVDAVIIAGDLYDKKNISATARNAVFHEIVNNPEIDFYYLKGNHDAESFLGNLEHIPDNLKLFGDNWTGYVLGEENGRKITITGVELNKDNYRNIYNSLVLNTEDFNIVVLHGQEADGISKGKTESINITELKNKGIDYLALGHIHSYKKSRLDARGIYCYPGCMEGRGFDECGEHGFVILDIDCENNGFNTEFVPIARRNLYVLETDISGCTDSAQIADRISQSIRASSYPSKSLVKIMLTGDVDVECEIDEAFLGKRFENEFYYIKIKDESQLVVNYEEYRYDESLKGEFVRRVWCDDGLTDEEKACVICYGIRALKGEEL
ncbi:MAG: exonuclease SbcCD subunit D [Butyrivibrio sp.]